MASTSFTTEQLRAIAKDARAEIRRSMTQRGEVVEIDTDHTIRVHEAGAQLVVAYVRTRPGIGVSRGEYTVGL